MMRMPMPMHVNQSATTAGRKMEVAASGGPSFKSRVRVEKGGWLLKREGAICDEVGWSRTGLQMKEERKGVLEGDG